MSADFDVRVLAAIAELNPTDVDARLAATMKVIFDEIPSRMNVVAIMRDAHKRISEAAGSDVPSSVINDKLVEVLREIASHAVEEFTRRTGQPFLWVDEPEITDPEPLMSFSLDDKGNVVF